MAETVTVKDLLARKTGEQRQEAWVQKKEGMVKSYEARIAPKTEIPVYDLLARVDAEVNKVLLRHRVYAYARLPYLRLARKIVKWARRYGVIPDARMLSLMIDETVNFYGANRDIATEVATTVNNLLLSVGFAPIEAYGGAGGAGAAGGAVTL